MTVKLKFQKRHSQAKLPSYQSAGAAGMDLYAVEAATLRQGAVSLLATGLSVEIPEGYELQIRARSGLAAKAGVFLVNGIGTIDSDYRGEIKVIMSTCQAEPVKIEAGDRIAQAVLCPFTRAECVEVAELSESERGEGGFGSTGLKAKESQ